MSRVIRVLFVGYLGRGQTSGMRCAALRRLGYDVVAVEAGRLWHGVSYPIRQFEQLSGTGTRIGHFNEAVLAAAASHRPQLVWAEKQEYLRPDTVRALQDLGAAVLHYNPDPYFSLAWKRTSLADECLSLYDALVVTKRYEMADYRRAGRGYVVYSPLGYDPIGHAPPAHSIMNPDAKVIFVGGWEPRRERLLCEVSTVTSGVAMWGYGWRVAQATRMNLLRALRLGRLTPGRTLYMGAPRPELKAALRDGEGANGEIYEDRYAEAVAGSRIAMGFVREVCPDQHTTRTFEIPAIGGFMLADRTEEHLEFFEEGKEAEYFGSDEEYLDKVRYYLSHDDVRDQVARAGHVRCLSSGYAYDDRIRAVMTELAL